MRRALSLCLHFARARKRALGPLFATLALSGLGASDLLGARTVLAQQAATVIVKIEGFKGSEGVALVALYDSAESWLKVPKAVQVVRSKITGSALSLELKGVKPGTYAVSVIHDENKNNELDMRWLPYPKPKEGAGVSGAAASAVGPPKWEDAKFELGAAGATLNIAIKYP